MQNTDLEVLEKLIDWLKQGQNCFLCTIVKTWGSSPRPAGSLLACNSTGKTVGSLSGGCVEENLIERLQANEIASHKPEYLEYGLDQDDQTLPGLPCGGTLAVVVEPILASPENLEQFTFLVSQLQAKQFVRRQINLTSGQVKLEIVDQNHPLKYDPSDPARPLVEHCYGPKHELFIIGAGMVSMYLADMALKLNYKVTVCDPRPEVVEAWPISGATVIEGYPDDAIRSYQKHSSMAIVALTHDPRIDDMGLMEALTTDAFYIAAMGSDRTSAHRRQRLLALGVSPGPLKKLHAPAGLAIGSKTPPEIALSIMAEITATRAQINQSKKSPAKASLKA